jgi:hypothetical protein
MRVAASSTTSLGRCVCVCVCVSLQCCYSAARYSVDETCRVFTNIMWEVYVVTALSQCNSSVVKVLLQCCYSAVTVLFTVLFTVATVLMRPASSSTTVSFQVLGEYPHNTPIDPKNPAVIYDGSTHTRTHTRTHAHTHTHTRTHMHARTHTHKNSYTHKQVCKYTHIHIHKHSHAHHTHTHSHTERYVDGEGHLMPRLDEHSAAVVLHCCYTTGTPLSHKCNTIVTPLSRQCITTVTPL